MRARILVVSLCLAFACAAAAAAGADRKARPPANGPDPAVSVWTEWPHQVACSELPFDPVTVFSGPTNAERGQAPPERALRAFLARKGIPWARRHNWRLLAESHERAEFGAGRLTDRATFLDAPELETMAFRRTRRGWRWQTYSSGCEPSSLRRGLRAITWDLASGQELTPATRRVQVDLGPGECNGGRSQNKRMQKPEFREQNGALLLSIWLRPVTPGPHSCDGLAEPPVTIELPEPLGERELMDGGTYPPQPAQPPVVGG